MENGDFSFMCPKVGTRYLDMGVGVYSGHMMGSGLWNSLRSGISSGFSGIKNYVTSDPFKNTVKHYGTKILNSDAAKNIAGAVASAGSELTNVMTENLKGKMESKLAALRAKQEFAKQQREMKLLMEEQRRMAILEKQQQEFLREQMGLPSVPVTLEEPMIDEPTPPTSSAPVILPPPPVVESAPPLLPDIQKPTPTMPPPFVFTGNSSVQPQPQPPSISPPSVPQGPPSKKRKRPHMGSGMMRSKQRRFCC